MAQIKFLLGLMLSLLCLHLALVAGSPLRPPEEKFTPTYPGDFEITPMVERAIPFTTLIGSPSTAVSTDEISHELHPAESSHHSHSVKSTHPPHRVPPPGHPERAIVSTTLVDGATTVEASQEFHFTSAFFTHGSHSAKMTHGPHTAPPHSAHSTHPLHTLHSTDGSHSAKSTPGEHSAHFTHGSHSAHFTRPGEHSTWAEDSDGPILTVIGSVPLPTHEWWKREAREKTPTPITFNPSTLPTMSTITLATGTECITTMYLPHYPPIGPKTMTVWTSTSTLYPEFDCHGCVTLTTVDPWTMGQPTTHYHHTKTTKSVLTVESPVCKPTSTL